MVQEKLKILQSLHPATLGINIGCRMQVTKFPILCSAWNVARLGT
uniref:Uncharacterized protein n=1 Tax=Arundo donax TaxID=35708 RepID=A0A0A9HKT7_ARUDO